MITIELPCAMKTAHTHSSAAQGTHSSIEDQRNAELQSHPVLDGTPRTAAKNFPNAQSRRAAVPHLPVSQSVRDVHDRTVDGDLLAGANVLSMPMMRPPRQTLFGDQNRSDAQTSICRRFLLHRRYTLMFNDALPVNDLAATRIHSHTHWLDAAATQLPTGQPPDDAQSTAAGGVHLPDAMLTPDTQSQTASGTNFGDQYVSDTQYVCVAESTSAGSHSVCDTQVRSAPGGFLRDPVLGVLADVVDDLEKVRIANANRVRQLTRTATDADGEERGFGLTLDHPEVAKLALTVKALEAAEIGRAHV